MSAKEGRRLADRRLLVDGLDRRDVEPVGLGSERPTNATSRTEIPSPSDEGTRQLDSSQTW